VIRRDVRVPPFERSALDVDVRGGERPYRSVDTRIN